jgi:hypothetical protein
VIIRDQKSTKALAVRLVASLLCVGVAVIHVIDQGGIPGSKTPGYVGIGYWILELVAVLTAVWLIASQAKAPWGIALGVAAGPLIGYVLSRGPGLPDYSDDKGNWAEPLGVLSLVVELGLLVLAVATLSRTSRTASSAHRG